MPNKPKSKSQNLTRAARTQLNRVRLHWHDHGRIPKIIRMHPITASFIFSLGLNPKDYHTGDEHPRIYERNLSRDVRRGRELARRRKAYKKERDQTCRDGQIYKSQADMQSDEVRTALELIASNVRILDTSDD